VEVRARNGSHRFAEVAFMRLYEVRPRKDHRGVDLISDALPFGLSCPYAASQALVGEVCGHHPRRVALGNEASLRCDNQFQIKYGLRTDEMRSCSLFRVCWIVK
jgi:hypothetical protein